MELVKFLFAAKLSLNLRQKVCFLFSPFSGMLCVSDDVVENVSVLRVCIENFLT